MASRHERGADRFAPLGGGKDMAAPSHRDVRVEPCDVRQAAPEHDDIGVEHVDDRRQAPRHPTLVPVERLARVALPCLCRLEDGRRAEGSPGAAVVIGLQAGAGEKRLDAPLPSAVARRPGML